MQTIDWIVCHGCDRKVTGGRVECPALSEAGQTRQVQVAQCLDCRHLIASPIDRLSEAMCSTDPLNSSEDVPY